MAHLSTDQIVALIAGGYDRVEQDGEYIHEKSGNLYMVAGLTLREADMALLVKYYDPYLETTPEIEFTRPIDEFLEKFKKK